MAKTVDEAARALVELHRQAQDLASRTAQFEEKFRNISEQSQESHRLSDEISSIRRTAEESQQRIIAAIASAEETRLKATALETQVQAYDDKFRAFQLLIDEREEAIKIGNNKIDELQKSLVSKDIYAEKILEKSNKMLGGATIAGLSSTFSRKVTNVDSQLKWARWGFYTSVVLLIFSVLVALNLVTFGGFIPNGLPPLPTINATAAASALAVQTLAALGSRALVILPALLLAGFASRRHAALFRLREEYSHKEALAVSVQGFKEQAPSYQEPIAAAVFQELLSNPARSIDHADGPNRENGFVQHLIAPVVKRALKDMFEKRDGVQEIPTGRVGG